MRRILGDWFSNEDSFIVVDEHDKIKTKTPSKNHHPDALIRKDFEKVFMSSEKIVSRQMKFYSTPKKGSVDGGSPLRVSFMEVSTICLERRETQMIKGHVSLKLEQLKFFPLDSSVAR